MMKLTKPQNKLLRDRMYRIQKSISDRFGVCNVDRCNDEIRVVVYTDTFASLEARFAFDASDRDIISAGLEMLSHRVEPRDLQTGPSYYDRQERIRERLQGTSERHHIPDYEPEIC